MASSRKNLPKGQVIWHDFPSLTTNLRTVALLARHGELEARPLPKGQVIWHDFADLAARDREGMSHAQTVLNSGKQPTGPFSSCGTARGTCPPAPGLGLHCRVLLALFFTSVLLFSMFWTSPAFAQGLASTSDIAKQPVEVTALSTQFLAAGANSDGSTGLESSRFVPMTLSATCSPESIQTGISCGMADMCGLDPCLCGASDEWGCCACSGTETTVPTVAYTSSDESVVRVIQAFDRTWIVPVSAGTATITCEASLIHFETVPATFQVSVAGPTAADALALSLIIVAVAVIVLAILAVRRALSRRNQTRQGDNHE